MSRSGPELDMSSEGQPGGERIGIFGGTFDPIHQGHLDFALAAQRACRLQRVLFIPSRHPWHKDQPLAGYADRLAMVRLALEDHPQWEALESPERGPTYSVDEVAWVQSLYPEAELWFLLGADAFRDLPRWKDYQRLLGMCNFVLAPRERLDLKQLPSGLVQPIADGKEELRTVAGTRVLFLGNFHSPLSSTNLRHGTGNVQTGVPALVEEYIRQQRLYGRG